MANMQRMLGAMLASRMAGRGGMGGALGSAAMLGLGGGRGGFGKRAGMAALGYLAWRSFQGRAAGADAPAAEPHGRASAAEPHGGPSAREDAGIAGALGTIVDRFVGGGTGAAGAAQGDSLADRLGAMLSPERAGERTSRSPGEQVGDPPGMHPAAGRPDPEEAAAVSEDTALLLIRAMIAAANADGAISPDERSRIVARLDEAGADAEDRAVIEAELAAPQPLDTLLPQVRDAETAQQFYLASRAAVDGTSDVQTAYLAYLRQRLGLPDADAAAAEELAR